VTGADQDRRGTIITFYSYKGGTGRTMALANVAWLLAYNGHRVLVLDWDLESPGLHRYFHPFLADKELRDSDGVIDLIQGYAKAAMRPGDGGSGILGQREIESLADIQKCAFSLDYPHFPDDGGIDLVPAGRQVPEYSTRVSTFNWDDLYERLGGGAFFHALRADLRRHYDYILIDSRTGLSDTAGICTVVLPDIIVNCFTMSTQSIDGAAAVARSIRSLRRDPIKIFPVPTRIEDGEQTKLDRSRAYARKKFEAFVPVLDQQDTDKYWGSVEIPYKIFYAYEETLAAFGDRSRQEGSLLSAYERLAGIITGTPCELPATLSDQARQRWLNAFERRTPAEPVDLVVSYAPRDRIWAEWIAAELDRVGQSCILRDVGASSETVERADRMLALLSEAYVQYDQAADILQRGTERLAGGNGRFLVPVRLDNAALPAPIRSRDVVILNSGSEERARDALSTALERLEPSLGRLVSGEGETWPRFPGTQPPIFKVPARNPGFTGRDVILETIRERLFAHAAAQPVALFGIGGVGKTQLAVEYAHRFAPHYEIVWWISADQPAIVRTELAKLAGRLGLPTGPSTSEQVEAVLEALQKGTRSPRWLIVFDNPDDPADLKEFMPAGPGDVIVTTRNAAWAQVAERIEVGVFERRESVELMTRRVRALQPADADAVAERLGDLPLVVEQAAAWLETTAMPVRNYLDLLDTRLSEVLAAKPHTDYPTSAAATWSLSLERLRRVRPAAARLMELFSFFSPEPIPTWLLSTPRMVEELVKVDRTLRDSLLIASLIQDIGRFALVRVDSAINAIRVHRLVQTVVRESLPVTLRSESRVQVQEILAAAAAARQGGVDDQGNWSAFEDLRTHLEPSGVLDSRDDAVRQFVLDTVQYLRLRGDLAGSEELAERTLKHWQVMFDAEDAVTLRMRVQLANTVRSLGRDRDSLRISEEVAPRMREILGPDHPYVLEAMSGVAADMWSFGRYREARPINDDVWERSRRIFGDDHVLTLKAANNVAHVERLFGNYSRAAEIDAETLRRRRRVLGDKNHWTLWSASNLGVDQRELGQYTKSREVLEDALGQLRLSLGEDHTDTLRAARRLAATLRKLGIFQEALRLIDETRQRAIGVVGLDHQVTAFSILEYACALSTVGDHTQALAQCRTALRYFDAEYGLEKPYALIAANNLGAFLLRAGDLTTARETLEPTVERFEALVGADHPHVVVCRANLANVHHALGQHAEARRLDEYTHGKLSTVLGEEHPTVLVVTSNLAISLRDTGAVADGQALADRALSSAEAILGPDHPNTVAIRARERINTTIELNET
jgi:MinD-like ATPase involved in chromosome partitioning or flagellar assembly/tetratricopeptide (TPR) repeat protein